MHRRGVTPRFALAWTRLRATKKKALMAMLLVKQPVTLRI
jgi:hypothetical protein